MKIGLISNPRSHRNKRGMKAIEEAVAGRPDVLHQYGVAGSDFVEILRDFAQREVGIVAVNGGDGTVQAVLTALLESQPFEVAPPLAVLPGGMTNMTAGDVGLRGRPGVALQRLIARTAAAELGLPYQVRHVLRMERGKDVPPQRGMFFGAAGICDLISWVCARVHPMGLRGEFAHGFALGTLLSRWMLGRLPERLFRGDEMAVALDRGPAIQAEQLLVLATTLDRLVLGSRPFWNQAGGAIRYTSIAHRPARLVRWAKTILYGPDRNGLPQCYFSRGVDRIELLMNRPFTVDGKQFEPAVARRVVLTAAQWVRFVHL